MPMSSRARSDLWRSIRSSVSWPSPDHCEPQVCAESTPGAAPDLRIDLVDNDPRLDLDLSWSPVVASGYHVLQSDDPSFESGVELIAAPTTETSFSYEDGGRTTPAMTFFQVRAVNVCHQEGP